MARGDRREPIVLDDIDRERFVVTLGEICAKTGWQMMAWVLMDNHYHWAMRTPEANHRGWYEVVSEHVHTAIQLAASCMGSSL